MSTVQAPSWRRLMSWKDSVAPVPVIGRQLEIKELEMGIRTMMTTRRIHVSLLGWFLTVACQNARPNAVPLSRSQIQGDTSRPPLPDQPNLPGDSTFTVEKPGSPRSQLLYYRNIVRIAFDDSTSGTTIRNVFSRHGATVIGGIPSHVDPEYILQVPDPGTTLEALNSVLAQLSQEPGVKWATSVYYRTPGSIYSRHPNDVRGKTRPPIDAIRAP